MVQMNLFTKQRQRCREKTYAPNMERGKGGWDDELEDWD